MSLRVSGADQSAYTSYPRRLSLTAAASAPRGAVPRPAGVAAFLRLNRQPPQAEDRVLIGALVVVLDHTLNHVHAGVVPAVIGWNATRKDASIGVRLNIKL